MSETISSLNPKPLVSVIMPVYNTEHFLRDSLDSVFAQSYKNIELICVDDNSKDDSLKILKEYKKKYGKRMKVIENKRNLGVGSSSNIAIAKSKGAFVARMDSDDEMHEHRIKWQVKHLLDHPKTVVVGGQVVIVDANSNRLGKKRFPYSHKKIRDMMFTMMPVQQGAATMNRTLLPKDFKFYMGSARVAEDVDLFFRLLNYGKFSNLRNNVISYRQYLTSTSLADPKKTFKKTHAARIRAIKQHSYVPTFRGVVVAALQYVLVSVLPRSWVYPMFSVLRGITSHHMSFKVSDIHLLLRTSIRFPHNLEDDS